MNLPQKRKGKVYLDSQVEDLTSASNTLEDAIRRIDKETRDRLIATFNEVNKNFTEFFKVLFNGGQAKLELLGEEILDTGIQVTAQPPGKKNTTISQLSRWRKSINCYSACICSIQVKSSTILSHGRSRCTP